MVKGLQDAAPTAGAKHEHGGLLHEMVGNRVVV